MKANLLALLMVVGFSASRLHGSEASDFVIHEWGTFTSVQGSDGVQLEWNPLVRTDLPTFVYDPDKLAAEGCDVVPFAGKFAVRSLTRMETPVIYFYSPEAKTVNVHVDFPQGRISEWYPRATGVGPRLGNEKLTPEEAARSFIEWKGVQVLPRGTAEISASGLIREPRGNHYYEARETDANFLRVNSSSRDKPQYERLLFYRGVGDFKSPLEVRIGDTDQELVASTSVAEPITDLFVVTIDGAQARYVPLKEVRKQKEEAIQLSGAPFRPLAEVRKQIMEDMRKALERHGLYQAEAQAMVNTWKDQWFAEAGTRVLYLLPRKWTDTTLPLKLDPSPDQLVRVMVGRSEVILPQMERELHRQIVNYSSGNTPTRSRIVAQVRHLGLGRFLEPAVTRALGSAADQALTDSARQLTGAVLDPTAANTVAQIKGG